MTEENPNGRPPKFKSVEDLQRKIDLYFSACLENRIKAGEEPPIGWTPKEYSKEDLRFMRNVHDKHPTITGLAIALDTTRKTLLDYENLKGAQFCNTVKRAKVKVEAYLEQRLYLNNPTGCIFNLKNNFSWEETNTTKHDGEMNININKKVLSARDND